MNWSLAVKLNQADMLRFLAVIFATLGVAPGAAIAMVPRHVRSTVLRLVQPLESAVRRLVLVKARGLSAPDYVPKAGPEQAIARGAKGARAPVFPLFDPRKRAGQTPPRPRAPGAGPRLSFFDEPRPVPPPPAPIPLPDDMVSAESLLRRLEAIRGVLNDVQRQARRLVRAQARRRSKGSAIKTTMRPGRPPGYRARPAVGPERAVAEVLRECHDLALLSLVPPDSS